MTNQDNLGKQRADTIISGEPMRLKDNYHIFAIITIVFWSLGFVFTRLANSIGTARFPCCLTLNLTAERDP